MAAIFGKEPFSIIKAIDLSGSHNKSSYAQVLEKAGLRPGQSAFIVDGGYQVIATLENDGNNTLASLVENEAFGGLYKTGAIQFPTEWILRPQQ